MLREKKRKTSSTLQCFLLYCLFDFLKIRRVAVQLAARRVARRQGQGAAGHAHRGLGQILRHGPAVRGRVVLLHRRLVALLRLVPAAQQVQLVGQRREAGGAHAEEERGGPAPAAALRGEDLHGEHVHALAAGPQLAPSRHVHLPSQGGGAVPAAGRLHGALLAPGVGVQVVARHGARVGAVDVPARHQDVSGGQGGAGVAAAGHDHGGAHLPGVGGRQVALGGGQQALHVAPADGEQAAAAGRQGEVGAVLSHAGQVEPGVEARVISVGGKGQRGHLQRGTPDPSNDP